MNKSDTQAIGVGAAAWFAAAMVIRFYGSNFFGAYAALSSLVLLYALTVPIIIGVLQLVNKQLNLSGLRAVALMSAAAAMLDAIAFAFFPYIYGLPASELYLAAAWLLYGLAVTLATAIFQ